MEVYVSKREEKRGYIKELKYCKDGTLKVEFADGRSFSNIRQCDENIEKINKVQEEQAKEGLENYVTFKSRFAKSIIYLGSCGVAYTIAAIGAFTGQLDPITFGCTYGIISIFGCIPSMLKLAINKNKIKELDKIKFRDENIDKLKSYKKYDNSLVGLSNCAKAYLLNYGDKEGNPFNMVRIDDYTKNDLETIVSNIDNEDSLGLEYVKK